MRSCQINRKSCFWCPTNALVDRILGREFYRFVKAGIFKTFLGYAIIFSFYHFVGLNYVIANVIAYAIGLIVTFVLHKKWVFESDRYFMKEIIPFITVFFSSYLVNIVFLVVSVKYVGIVEDIGQVIGIIGYSTCNFIGNKFWTFNKFKVIA